MRPSNRLTPYPILTTYSDDYLNATIGVHVDVEQVFGSVRISVAFELDEPAIGRLIAEGSAAFAIHIECPSTSYRRFVESLGSNYSTTLDRQSVRDAVEVCTYVVAREHISSFSSPNFHPDYGDIEFDIGEGDVLAIGECLQLKIRNEDDIARRPSIIKVSGAGSTQRDAMAVHTDGNDAVLVSLRPELYELYRNLGAGEYSEAIFSLIMLPALQTVLTRMVEDSDDGVDSEKEWFKSIKEILAKEGIAVGDIDNYSDDMSALAVAQRILSQPLERSLGSLVRED